MQNIINTNEDEKNFLKLCETLLITVVYSTISTAVAAAAVSATTNIARVRALSRVVVLTI